MPRIPFSTILFLLILTQTATAVNETLVNLPMSNDTQQIDQLCQLMKSYEFTVTYGPHFICREFSAAMWQFLSKLGYNVKIACYYGGKTQKTSNWGHCYIVVKMPHGWVPIESTDAHDYGEIGYIPKMTSGKVTYLADCILVNNSEELYEYDLKDEGAEPPFYTGDLTRFIKSK